MLFTHQSKGKQNNLTFKIKVLLLHGIGFINGIKLLFDDIISLELIFKMLILYTENLQRIPLISFIFIKFAELHDCIAVL